MVFYEYYVCCSKSGFKFIRSGHSFERAEKEIGEFDSTTVLNIFLVI